MSRRSRIHLPVIIFAVGLLTACNQTPQSALVRADRLLAEGNRAGAVLELKSAIQRAPDDPALRGRLGLIYGHEFEWVNAAKELRRARSLGLADDPTLALALGQSLRHQGEFGALLKELPLRPDWPAAARAELRAQRGRCEHALGDGAAAAASLTAAKKDAPDNAEVILLEAQLRASQSDVAGALQLVEGVLARLPQHYDAVVYRAYLLRANDRPAEAIKAWDTVLALNPHDFAALLNRSALWLAADNLDAAARDATQLRTDFPAHPYALVQHGMIVLAQGKPRVALDDAQLALRSAPALHSATLLAGLSHLALGAHAQAAEMLKVSSLAQPDNALARRAYGEALLRGNQPAAALSALAPALVAGSEDVRAITLAAQAQMALNDRAAAEALLARAGQLRPEDNALQLRRALANLGDEQDAAGLSELGTALKQSKGATAADEVLILARLRQGETQQANAALSALMARAPASPITHNLEGAVRLAGGDRAAAKAAFERALSVAPEFLPARVNLANLSLANGDVEEARRAYQAGVAAAPKAVPPRLALADFEARHAQPKAAQRALEEAMTQAPQDTAPPLALIRLALATKAPALAIQTADAAGPHHPDDPALLRASAEAFLLAGKAARADEILRHYLSVSSASANDWLMVANLYRQYGQQAAADRSLEQGLAQFAGDASLQVAWASSLIGRTRYEEASAFIKTVQTRQPKAPLGWLLEADLQAREGHASAAVEALSQALQRQPVGQIAWQLFLAQRRTPQKASALAAFTAWTDAHPDDAFAQTRLGDVLQDQANYAAAIQRYEAALRLKAVTPDLLNNLAWACFEAKDPRARQFAEAAWQAAPNSPLALDTLGWILLREQQLPQALAALTRARQLAPTQPDIRYHYAAALAATGKAPEAHEELSQVLKADQSFPSRPAAEALLASLR
jgi:putative PEP-CTERM system TPR-repeat lipoprotein